MTVRNKSTDRRGQILRTAAALFIKNGYSDTHVRDIASLCGINISTLYHYIGSKHNILEMFLVYSYDILEKFINQHRESLYNSDPVETLRKSLERYISIVDENQDLVVFWYQEAKDLTPLQFQKQIRLEEHIVQFYEELISWGNKNGSFSVKDVKLVANNIIVTCDMWAFRRWMIRKHFTLKDFNKRQIETIMTQVMSNS
jgi:TetR/AcrR family transcriptional regulator, cholesterol catabolism regulator